MSVIGTRRCPETEGTGNALGWGSEKILRHGGNNMNLGGGEAPEGRRRKDIRETSVCKGSAGSEDIMSSGRRVWLRRHRHMVNELLRKELPRWVGQQSFIHLFTQAGPGLFSPGAWNTEEEQSTELDPGSRGKSETDRMPLLTEYSCQ